MKGSCLCGKVVYEIDALATPITHCSCVTCRKAHSAAFNTGAGVLPEKFRWIRGEDHLKSYESSPGKKRYFCGHCGTQLVAIKQGAPYYILRVGSLDDDPGKVPERRIWVSHEVDWMEYRGDLPEHQEWPPARK